MLNPGDTYTPEVPVRPSSAHSIPSNRKYRAVVLEDATDMVHEVRYFDSYSSAHMFTLDCDSLYNYPQDVYFVERSTDNGTTWQIYNADEFINGTPAWVVLRGIE
jgi:hypothetical protein